MSYKPSFDSRTDLHRYSDNALLLYALELKLNVEDIHLVAAEALTDGQDDKKCDLIYVDLDQGVAVIAQGYMSANPDKPHAKPNKASDLNTAVGWLFGRRIEDIPERIRPAAKQLRDALATGAIRTVEIWLVHNLPESESVQQELRTVEGSARAALQSLLVSSAAIPDVSGLEIGVESLDSLYTSLQTTIRVGSSFEVQVPSAFQIDGPDWNALVTTLPAIWLHDIFLAHRDSLFSANVRGYLGSRKVDENINNGIKQTAADDPEHFWVFNNGITLLVHDFAFDSTEGFVRISGLSIVNGAQTTGALGALRQRPSENALVPARIVRCTSPDVVRRIIRYNNSQNRVEAPDFRSNDRVQDRLRNEFTSIPNVTYTGGRRGGSVDRIPRVSDLLPSETAGQALASFHGDPILAYNGKSRIWEDDSAYGRYFSDRTTARHILFCYSLLKVIEDIRTRLRGKSNPAAHERDQLSFLRERGSIFLLVAAIATCIEVILDRAIPDKFRLTFVDERLSPEASAALWGPIADSLLAFSDQLKPALEAGFNNAERTKSALSTFKSMVVATSKINKELFDEFSRSVSGD